MKICVVLIKNKQKKRKEKGREDGRESKVNGGKKVGMIKVY